MGADVSGLPFSVETLPNDPRHEFIFIACDGLPKARQKRLIMLARSPEVSLIDDADARVISDALGLKDA